MQPTSLSVWRGALRAPSRSTALRCLRRLRALVPGTGEEGAPRAAADHPDACRHLGEGVGAVHGTAGQGFASVEECSERSGAINPALEVRAHFGKRPAQVLVVELPIEMEAAYNDARMSADGRREGRYGVQRES